METLSTTMVKMFWDFLIFYKIFLSPQVKWNVVIINPLSTNPQKWSTTLKQIFGCCRHKQLTCVLPFLGKKSLQLRSRLV